MRKTLRILPQAEIELTELFCWYEEKAPNLGFRIYNEFNQKINFVLDNPFACQQIHPKVRKANLYKFPVSFVYKITEDELTIISIFHSKKNPENISL